VCFLVREKKIQKKIENIAFFIPNVGIKDKLYPTADLWL